jgi:hypothetical protein
MKQRIVTLMTLLIFSTPLSAKSQETCSCVPGKYAAACEEAVELAKDRGDKILICTEKIEKKDQEILKLEESRRADTLVMMHQKEKIQKLESWPNKIESFGLGLMLGGIITGGVLYAQKRAQPEVNALPMMLASIGMTLSGAVLVFRF